jgi:hypothetical protein
MEGVDDRVVRAEPLKSNGADVADDTDANFPRYPGAAASNPTVIDL